MFRLFLPLYLMLVIFGTAMLVGLEYLPDKLLERQIADYDTRITIGTFNLLEQAIVDSGKPPHMALRQLQPHFGYRIDLLDRQHSGLDDEQWQQLMDGAILNLTLDQADSYFRRFLNTQLVLLVTFSDSYVDATHREAQGTFYLVSSHLEGVAEQHWPAVIEQLQPQFGFPIRLQPIDSLELPARSIQLIRQGKIIDSNQETDLWSFHGRLFNSEQVLTMGPAMLPFSPLQVTGLIILTLIVLLALAIMLWVAPLWLAVRELSRAADAFGKGDLQARAKIGRRSPILTLGRRFNAMATQIAQLIQGHRELTNAVSHELRTPIARMRFGLEMLNESASRDDRHRFISSLNDDVDELDTLIDELLIYARFETNAPLAPRESVPLRPWLEQLIDHACGYAGSIRLQLDCSALPPDTLVCLRQRDMARALHNLLRNGCRYANTEVRMTISRQPGENFSDSTQLLIQVDDDGPGIPEAHRQRIFDVFTRVEESRDRQSGGYGLGLAIVRKVVESHDGTIVAETSPLGGARLSMQLPDLLSEECDDEPND